MSAARQRQKKSSGATLDRSGTRPASKKERKAKVDRAGRQEFDLDEHIFYLFGQIYGRRDTDLNRSLRQFGLSVPKWRVLAVLTQADSFTIGELADLTAVDRTTLSRTLERMERDGLIQRKPRPRDRRRTDVRLKAKGAAAFERIWPLIRYHNERAIEGLKANEIATLKRIVRKMIANVKRPAEL